MTYLLAARARDTWIGMMPGVFVVLWGTGFIGGKLGLPYAPPLTFLALRFAIVALLLLGLSLARLAPWPRRCAPSTPGPGTRADVLLAI